MFISIEEVPHSNSSCHCYLVQVTPLSFTAYNSWMGLVEPAIVLLEGV